MAADIESVRIAAEASGVFVDPSDAAAHLICHHAKVAVGGLDGDEVERDIVGTSVHEQLCRKGIVLSLTA